MSGKLLERLIPLNTDIMFTEVFNNPDNICVLEEFVAGYFNYNLKDVKGNLKILSRRLNKEIKRDSRKEVDLLLNYHGKKINIEMANYMKSGVLDRNIVYICKVHGSQLKIGDKNYRHIKPSVQISFDNAGYSDKLIETYYLKNDQGDVLTNNLRIDIINVAKGKDLWYTESEVDFITKWCKLLTEKSTQNLIECSKEILSEYASNTLVSCMNQLSGDDEMIRLYTGLSKQEMEYNTIASIAEDAKKELEHSREELEDTKEKLENKTVELENKTVELENKIVALEKSENSRKTMIKAMIENGMDINDIVLYTGLSVDEINMIK